MTAAVDELPASYAAVHRYNGAVLQHDAREQIVPMAIQPRDFAIVLDVWRYKFVTAPMVHELHWDGGSLWPAQRRLQKMFNAGLLERFRPVSLRGSYPWMYHLGERGHVILRDSQAVETGWRYRPHVVHEFGHVLHELQLNAWVLAYRRQPEIRFLSWEGERTIEPPPTTREEREEPRWLPGGGWTVHGLRDLRHRPVRPDAVIEIDRGECEVPYTLLLEFDRTRRVDKNFEMFRRYDTFLVWWWNWMDLFARRLRRPRPRARTRGCPAPSPRSSPVGGSVLRADNVRRRCPTSCTSSSRPRSRSRSSAHATSQRRRSPNFRATGT